MNQTGVASTGSPRQAARNRSAPVTPGSRRARFGRGRGRRAGGRSSGSVSGQDAVAEVEDVARPAGGLAEDRRRAAPGGAPSRRAGARVEVALDCRDPADPSASRPRARSRQSSPMTSPPASAIASSSAAVPVPKWIDGHVRSASRRRCRRTCGATDVRSRRGAERADPAVEELERPARRRRPAPAGRRRSIVDRRSISAVPQRRARACMNAFGRREVARRRGPRSGSTRA